MSKTKAKKADAGPITSVADYNKRNPLTQGMARKWVKCRGAGNPCGKVYAYTYQPYSLSNPIIWTPCGHSLGHPGLNCDDITAEQADAYFRAQVGPKVKGAHLVVRKDGILCSVCGEVEPIHAGDGTPLPSLMEGYKGAMKRHPATKHERHTPRPR